MLSLLSAIIIVQNILFDVTTLNESRLKPEYFTRNHKMPFSKLIKFLLSIYKNSSQSSLNHFFEKDDITMSQQALSKARNKFNHTPFSKMYYSDRDAFFEEKYLKELNRFDGKIIIAIDGSDTPLPNLPELCSKFGGTGAKASSPTARMSIAYYVLNDFIMESEFTPMSVS